MSAMMRPSGEPPLRSYLDQPQNGPTALRIVLGARLRKLRQELHISRPDAGEAIRGSHAKISRLELGQVASKERDLADLLTLYKIVDPAERADFFALARQANAPGWWHQYSDVIEDFFELHIGLEEAASLIRTYEVQFLPGLLQTEQYAYAVTGLGYPDSRPQQLDRLVEVRMRRQKLLDRPEAPILWAVLDEAVLRRSFGGPDVMRAQLEHLLQVMEKPNVTVQVAPFSVSAAAAGTPITILRFSEPTLPDKVYLEQLTSAVYLDKESEIDQYSLIMARLGAAAHTPEASRAFIEKLLAEPPAC
ncbi:helix-turn-helix domain-containing protein [Streptomyces sp. N2-109]|uniref:Helix-turn-helix domain-containing protein n=1 Tax=Streptomyces gossypii TaxID=2883101 RepID=A0ABT2JPN7_9ACTN|nr:helix-turn-helix transcriptional regulator [Streptomyces gossypii]MCT2589345.1 helix-turn-helix domain-containing protein [Streptomyces gossypii]